MRNSGENRVLKTSIVYVLVSLFNKGIGIITVPLFTRLLSTAEMGVFTTWITWVTMITPIATMSLVTSSMYIAFSKYIDNREKYQSSILLLSNISTSILFIIYLLFDDVFNKITTLSTPLMVFMFIYLLFSPALDMWLLKQRYEYNTKKMAIVSLISNILSASVAVVAVVILQQSSYNLGELRVYATYGVMILFCLYFYIYVFRKGKCMYNKEFWHFGLKVSIPLIVHTLAKNILDVIDRSMISYYCGKDAVGVYGTIYSISTLSLIVWSAINNAFVPYLYEKLAIGDSENKSIQKMSYTMILLYAIVCVLITLIAPEIVILMATDEYYAAVYIIPPVAAGIFLTCVYNLFANVILYHKKSSWVMWPTVIAALANVILNSIFIPKCGYIAAAYTTLIACIILSILQGVAMRKVHVSPLYNMKLIAVISCIMISICLLTNLLYQFLTIRYIVVVTIIIIMLFFKKKIWESIRKIKG